MIDFTELKQKYAALATAVMDKQEQIIEDLSDKTFEALDPELTAYINVVKAIEDKVFQGSIVAALRRLAKYADNEIEKGIYTAAMSEVKAVK